MSGKQEENKRKGKLVSCLCMMSIKELYVYLYIFLLYYLRTYIHSFIPSHHAASMHIFSYAENLWKNKYEDISTLKK